MSVSTRQQLAEVIERALEPYGSLPIDAANALAARPKLLIAAASELREQDDPAARALIKRLTAALEDLARHTFDPGTEALGAIYEGRQFALRPESRPRVWQDGDDIPAGTHVVDNDGRVHLVGEDEPAGEPIRMLGFGKLVEVVLPDHAAEVARMAAEAVQAR